MADLIATGPLEGQVPFEAAGVVLDVLPAGPLALIAPYPGRTAAASAALEAAFGAGFPAPGQVLAARDGARIIWMGREGALLIGAAPPPLADAAVIDLTDGWAGLVLGGAGAEAVLARLVPIDLRPAAFPEGSAARSLLGHVQALLLRSAAGLEIHVMRSYARTAWHEIETAMRGLAARAAASG